MLTQTAYGKRYVRQPVESCFGRRSARADDLSTESPSNLPQDTGSVTMQAVNRNFSNEWLKIDKSPLGGYGAFALQDIKAYSHLLLERPFLKVRSCSDVPNKVQRLGAEEKAVYDNLHGYSRRNIDEASKKFSSNRYELKHAASSVLRWR